MRARIGVLASGGGTNLQAIVDHLDRLGDARAADVVLVASDRAKAGALGKAAVRGIATHVLRESGARGGDELSELLVTHRIDLVVLAGYLRLVPPMIVQEYQGRIVNIHPSLLPAFGGPGMYGIAVHRAVLDSGASVSGATVHLVNDEYDRGEILAQWPVPVLEGDDPTTLAARILRVEHLLYPAVVSAIAARIAGRPEILSTVVTPQLAFSLVALDDDALGADISRLGGRLGRAALPATTDNHPIKSDT